jgi:hypothetical protein
MQWETFHIILSISASKDVLIQQFNVKSAYLHGMMQEEVWVQQPEGFEVPGKEHLALPLLKVLYGMKQGSNQWHKTLFGFLVQELGWH